EPTAQPLGHPLGVDAAEQMPTKLCNSQSSMSAATNQDTNRKPLQWEEGLHTGQPANAPERAASKSSDASSPALRCAKACLERRTAGGRNCSPVGDRLFLSRDVASRSGTR